MCRTKDCSVLLQLWSIFSGKVGVASGCGQLNCDASIDVVHNSKLICREKQAVHNYTYICAYNYCYISSIARYVAPPTRSDFTGASTAESCLLLLSRPLPWRPALSATIATTLGIGLENMDLSSMFSLLILAGFPKVSGCGLYMGNSPGSSVQYSL